MAYAIRLVLRKPWHCFFGTLAAVYVLWMVLLMRAPASAAPAPAVPREEQTTKLVLLETESSPPSAERFEPTTLPVTQPLKKVEPVALTAPIPRAVPAQPPSLENTYWVWPAEEISITSSFGERINPLSDAYQNHHGLDIRSACGTPVLAAAAGEVIFAQRTAASGNVVKIAHPGGFTTRYAHLSRLDVTAGERVEAGREIGLSGATGHTTGPHLHFEIRQGEEPVNPLAFKYHAAPPSIFAHRDPFVDCGGPASSPDEYLVREGHLDDNLSENVDSVLEQYSDYVRTY